MYVVTVYYLDGFIITTYQTAQISYYTTPTNQMIVNDLYAVHPTATYRKHTVEYLTPCI